MNTPCKKCNELNKPCCDEHSGKIAEPQLSAEMEKRLMDLLPLGLDDWLVEDIKHFLATALEEQKEEVIEELLKHMRKVMFEWHGTGWAMVDDYKERFLNRKEVMSKLEGYYMGVPVYSNPECPPDLLYVVNNKKFAINFPLRKDGKPDMRYKINRFERAFNQLKGEMK